MVVRETPGSSRESPASENDRKAVINMKKFLAIAAISLTSAVGVAGAVGPATAAEASEMGTSSAALITQPTTSYTSPSMTSAPVHRFDQGTMVETICYTEGQRFNDNPYWFRVSSGGNAGFVHRDAISLSSTQLPHC